jgi:hypothetical protein
MGKTHETARSRRHTATRGARRRRETMPVAQIKVRARRRARVVERARVVVDSVD